MRLVYKLTLVLSLLLSIPLSVADSAKELSWEDLMPEGFYEDELFLDYNPSNFEDDDPEGMAQFEAFQKLLQSAPVVESLDGKEVSIAGFTLPLEGDQERTHLFLLVPYFGACIHVPPPPANQIILVRSPKGIEVEELFMPLKVTGTLHIEATDTDLAHAGYSLDMTAGEAVDVFE